MKPFFASADAKALADKEAMAGKHENNETKKQGNWTLFFLRMLGLYEKIRIYFKENKI